MIQFSSRLGAKDLLMGKAWAAAVLAASLLSGCKSTEGPKNYDIAVARFVFESGDANGYASVAELPVSRVRIPLSSGAALSEFDIEGVQVAEVELGRCLVFAFSPAASRALMRESSLNLGKRLVLLINGQPIGVRKVEQPISDGRIFMFLETKDGELEKIANDIVGTSLNARKRIKK